MWKVGEVEPVRVMGAEGYPYGFNVRWQAGCLFCLCIPSPCRGGGNPSESALLNAISVRPNSG
jgi:hypothetical protein